MKNTNLTSRALLRVSIAILAVATGMFATSCKDDAANKPAPTVTIDPTSASNIPGNQATTSATVESPEGGATLKITVNGVADATLPDVALDGTASQVVPVAFTIPAAAPIGATFNIALIGVDKKGQLSTAVLFAVTVSATAPKPIVPVSGTLTGAIHWTKDNIYELNGFVRIGEDTKPTAGTVAPVIGTTGQLTIDAGTVIYGKFGAPGGALIIHRGSTITAIGTAAEPIVFTSGKSIGSKKPGDWSGVVICGKGRNNFTAGNSLLSTSTGVDQIEELEGGYGGFHGGGAAANNADNSGTVKYVRIEYGGYPINANQELNGLTLGSVGSGTTLGYIQVTYANDDSFEWFGGAVNADHLIAYKGIDDDFDTDNGYLGKVQFGLAIRDAAIADQSGSNGFESDNNATGNQNDGTAPITSPQFSNMTIIGGKATAATTIDLQFQNGAQIRRNSALSLYNSIITGFPNGVFIDGTLPAAGTPGSGGSVAKASAGTLVLKSNIFAGVDSWGGNGYGSASTADETAAVTGLPFGANANHPNNPRGRIVPSGAGAFTNGVFGYNAGAVEQNLNGMVPPAWLAASNTMAAKWSTTGLDISIFEPLNGTPILAVPLATTLGAGADFTGLTGFTVTTYRGAFTTTDWTTGWVNWNPAITDYSH